MAGVLKGGRRKVDTVESRSMVALDGDRIDAAFLENYESICPYTSALYTTHSSTEENPRVRLVFPLTRDVTPEEFVAVSRYLAQMLGIDYFDECSYQPNQLMYWPSTPANGSFVYKETDGGWLDPDAILTKHPEWTDPSVPLVHDIAEGGEVVLSPLAVHPIIDGDEVDVVRGENGLCKLAHL